MHTQEQKIKVVLQYNWRTARRNQSTIIVGGFQFPLSIIKWVDKKNQQDHSNPEQCTSPSIKEQKNTYSFWGHVDHLPRQTIYWS